MSKKPTVTRDEKRWEIELKGEIAADSLEGHRKHVIAELKKDAHLQGFRPGKAPEEQVVKTVGEAEILRRTIEHAVHHELPEMLAAENAPIVAAPQVTVESAPKGFPATEPIIFTARAPLAPEVKLPDYVRIAKKHNEGKKEKKRREKRQGSPPRRPATRGELKKEAKIHYPEILKEYELDDLEGRMK